MNPTIQDVHVNTPLTNLSIAYQQDADGFISDQVFPSVPVQFRSDRYYTYARDAFFRSDATERAPATESQGTDYDIDSTPTYFCRIYSVHKDIADEIRSNSDSVLNPDRDATELVTQQLLIQRETKWATTFFKTGVWARDRSGVPGTPSGLQFKQWDQAGSTPIEDVTNEKLVIKQATGKMPNVLVLGPYVYNQLRNNPEIVERVKYTQLGFIDLGLLALAFGVQKILVPDAIVNSAAEGTALNMGFIYGKGALLAYSEDSPGLMKASAGYTFNWTKFLGAGATVIRRIRMEAKLADRVEGFVNYDMKVIASDMATFWATAVS